MDTGDMLLQHETKIGENETYGELYSRLAVIGAETLRETIERLADGTLPRTKQDDALATKCAKIKKEDACIDFSKSSQRIHDLVRGLNPEPCAFAMLSGQKIKIISTRLFPMRSRIKFCKMHRYAVNASLPIRKGVFSFGQGTV